MKILFGVQGTGNGHLSRARAMGESLAAADVDVDYLFSGRQREKFFDMELFGDFQVKEGLTFMTDNGRVQYLKTAANSKPLRFFNDIRQLNLEPYDVIISDFEPVVAWAGKLRKKTVIGVGHQPAFHYPIPLGEKSLLSTMVLRHFAPATVHLGLHWHHFNQPLLPPIVPSLLQPGAAKSGKILVYLPFERPEAVMALLKPFTRYQFYIYSPYHTADEDSGHLHQRKVSLHGFHHDMLTAEGVICNAGFETPSECLQLGKKILVKPLHKQMEQIANAVALKQLGWGDSMETLCANAVEQWLNAEPPGQQVSYPNVAQAIVEWVLAGNWQQADVARLSEQLWAQTINLGSE
jgi:uncharacterized protein (TIGR00661 family)